MKPRFALTRSVAIERIRADGEAVIDMLASGVPTTEVLACPGWTLEDLGDHLARVYAMVALALLGTDGKRVDRSGLADRPPEQPASEYLAERLSGLLSLFQALPDDARRWNFIDGPDADASFWWRRQLHETAIHRVDAELAAGRPVSDLPPPLAADGVDDFLMLARYRVVEWDELDLGGSPLTIHLHATDMDVTSDIDKVPGSDPAEWTIDTAEQSITRAHLKADVAMRGPAWSIDRWLWGRLPSADTSLEIFGDKQALESWRPAL